MVLSGESYNAVNGEKSGIWSTGQCFHSNSETGPYWTAELVESTTITKVVLYNRLDFGIGKLQDYSIYIGDSYDHTQNSLCGDSSAYSYSNTIYCNMKGRYLTVELTDTTANLQLCEVEAFGTSSYTLPSIDSENIMLNATVSASSTYSSYSADRAIDGD